MRPRAGDVVRYLRERAHDIEVVGKPDTLATPAQLECAARDALLRAAEIVEAAAAGDRIRFKR